MFFFLFKSVSPKTGNFHGSNFLLTAVCTSETDFLHFKLFMQYKSVRKVVETADVWKNPRNHLQNFLVLQTSVSQIQ